MADDRIDQILDAAYACFTRHGVKRTTMDDIASAAGMSRPGVYQYVRGKDDAFRRLAQRLFDGALEQTRRDVEGDAPVAERLHRVLSTKLELTLGLYADSPHAGELLDAGARLSGDVVEAFNAGLRDLAASTVADAARRGEVALGRRKPADVAEIALALTRGLEMGTGEPRHLRRQLRLGVDLLLDGLLPAEAPG